MCGIVGVVSNCVNGFTQKEMDVFTNLLFLDTIRGFDSTGVFGVHNNSNLVLHKDAINGLDFLGTAEYRAFRAEMISSGKMVVGHNRAATRGNVVDTNAHPFVVDDKIVLVQNGTYKGDHKHHKNTEVDTEAMAHVISESATIEEALQKINAAYAFVWYNADDKTLNLIRNHERPLYLADFHGTGFAFASESTMLSYSFGRAEVPLKAPPELLPEHTLVTLTLDGKGGYTRKDTKLDAAYRFPKSSSAAADADWWESNYQPTQGGNYASNPHGGNRRYNHNAVGWQSPAPNRTHSVGGANDVKNTFVDAVYTDNPQFLFPSREDATKHVDFFHGATVGGFHYIETLDYLAANNNKACTAWHIFGTLVHQDEAENSPTVLVHWLVYDKTEEEVLEMSVNKFYKCKVSVPILRSMPKGHWSASVYCSDHELLENVSVTQ